MNASQGYRWAEGNLLTPVLLKDTVSGLSSSPSLVN